MAYFIAVSRMNFICESNQVRRLKQLKFFIIFWHGKVKGLNLWKFLKKRKFINLYPNGKEHLVMKKFHLKTEVEMLKKYNIKRLVWMVYQYHGVIINRMHYYIMTVQGYKIFLMMDFEKEGIDLNLPFVCFNVI